MKHVRPVMLMLLTLVTALAALAACTPTAAPPLTLTPTPERATPIADQPAAGICASFEETIVSVTLYPDIPDPRCAEIRPDQQLRVINATDGPIDIALGSFEATLDPGTETTFDAPFGTYLAPGVHRLDVHPCCGGELWLKEGLEAE